MYFASFEVRDVRIAARHGCVLASYPVELDVPYLDFMLPSHVGGIPYIAASLMADVLPSGSDPSDVYTFAICEDVADVEAYWHTLHYLVYAGQVLGPVSGGLRYWYFEDVAVSFAQFVSEVSNETA